MVKTRKCDWSEIFSKCFRWRCRNFFCLSVRIFLSPGFFLSPKFRRRCRKIFLSPGFFLSPKFRWRCRKKYYKCRTLPGENFYKSRILSEDLLGSTPTTTWSPMRSLAKRCTPFFRCFPDVFLLPARPSSRRPCHYVERGGGEHLKRRGNRRAVSRSGTILGRGRDLSVFLPF